MTTFRNSIRDGEVLLSKSKIPSDDILESLYKLRIRESDQLKTVLELYDMEIHQKISVPNYKKLKTMVKRSIDQKLRLRNFDARHGKIESAAVGKNRKGIIGVDGGKGICYQWREKAGSQGDRCSFRHVTQDCAQKPEHTAATLSEPALSRGRSASGKKSIRGKVTMDPFAAKFEDRSHEETGRQQRCAQSEAWDVAKNIYKLLENDRAKFFSLTKKYVLPSASSRES